MLIQRPQVRIVTRPVTLDNGEAAFAYFALVNFQGQMEVRFLGTKLASEVVSDTAYAAAAQAEAVLALPAAFKAAFYQAVKSPFCEYVAPFVSTLSFFTSQPARAPSVN